MPSCCRMRFGMTICPFDDTRTISMAAPACIRRLTRAVRHKLIRGNGVAAPVTAALTAGGLTLAPYAEMSLRQGESQLEPTPRLWRRLGLGASDGLPLVRRALIGCRDRRLRMAAQRARRPLARSPLPKTGPVLCTRALAAPAGRPGAGNSRGEGRRAGSHSRSHLALLTSFSCCLKLLPDGARGRGMAEAGPVCFAQVALEVARAALPPYRSKLSKRAFTQPQLLLSSALCATRAGPLGRRR